MNMDTIIETKNLTKKFGNFTANDHIDLAVKEGGSAPSSVKTAPVSPPS